MPSGGALEASRVKGKKRRQLTPAQLRRLLAVQSHEDSVDESIKTLTGTHRALATMATSAGWTPIGWQAVGQYNDPELHVLLAHLGAVLNMLQAIKNDNGVAQQQPPNPSAFSNQGQKSDFPFFVQYCSLILNELCLKKTASVVPPPLQDPNKINNPNDFTIVGCYKQILVYLFNIALELNKKTNLNVHHIPPIPDDPEDPGSDQTTAPDNAMLQINNYLSGILLELSKKNLGK